MVQLSQADKDLLATVQSIVFAAKPRAPKGELFRYYATVDRAGPTHNGGCHYYPSDHHAEFGIVLPRVSVAQIDWLNGVMDDFFARHEINTSTFLWNN